MKPKTIIHLVQGRSVKVTEPMDGVAAMLAQERPFAVTRVTDHGTTKRAVIRAGAILHLEEA